LELATTPGGEKYAIGAGHERKVCQSEVKHQHQHPPGLDTPAGTSRKKNLKKTLNIKAF
jgi:hypothetical protein